MGSPAAFEEMKKNMTPEKQKTEMDAWMQWMGANTASFVDGGAPLGKNTRVTKDAASELSNEIGGYSIVQAESKEDVAKLMQSGPHFSMPGMYVEVMEIMPMP